MDALAGGMLQVLRVVAGRRTSVSRRCRLHTGPYPSSYATSLVERGEELFHGLCPGEGDGVVDDVERHPARNELVGVSDVGVHGVRVTTVGEHSGGCDPVEARFLGDGEEAIGVADVPTFGEVRLEQLLRQLRPLPERASGASLRGRFHAVVDICGAGTSRLIDRVDRLASGRTRRLAKSPGRRTPSRRGSGQRTRALSVDCPPRSSGGCGSRFVRL